MKNVVLFTLLSGLLVFSSCAKKPSGVRAVKQVGSVMMNNPISNLSIQAAQAQNLKYDLTSLEWPTVENNAPKVTSEILTPKNKYIVFSTSHENNNDAYGREADTDSQTELDIRARCEGAACDKYLLLVTIVKGGYAVHQMAAISYTSDCQYNLENINSLVSGARFYTSLDELNQKASQYPPRDDRKNGCL